MEKQTFILRNESVRANLMATIATLGTDELMEVIIRPYKRNRSLEQNALYWKWLGVIGDETGNTADDIHEWCKQKFLPPSFVDINGEVHETRRTTTRLKVNEMSAYMTAVHAWATGELGIYLPIPEDRLAA